MHNEDDVAAVQQAMAKPHGQRNKRNPRHFFQNIMTWDADILKVLCASTVSAGGETT